LVVADDTADPDVVCADMLAQCEHDSDASAILVTPSAWLADAVDEALNTQLSDLPNRHRARGAAEQLYGARRRP